MATSAKCQKHNTPHNVVAVALAVVAVVVDDVNVVAVAGVVVVVVVVVVAVGVAVVAAADALNGTLARCCCDARRLDVIEHCEKFALNIFYFSAFASS